MKRTLIALLAAGFAFAASSSFAQTAEPTTPAPTKSAKPKSTKTKHHKSSHKVAHKSGKTNVAHKKAAPTA
jgi:hypothetical protein